MQNIALFLDEHLNQIGTKKFDSTDEFITFKKGTFNIRLNAFLYKNKDSAFFAYIYPTDEKLLIDVKIEPIKEDNLGNPHSARIIKIKEKLEHGDLKLIVGESIIGQLAHIAIMGLKTNWVLLLIVGVSCLLGGSGLGYGIGVSHVPTYLNNTVSYLTPSITPYPSPIIIG